MDRYTFVSTKTLLITGKSHKQEKRGKIKRKRSEIQRLEPASMEVSTGGTEKIESF